MEKNCFFEILPENEVFSKNVLSLALVGDSVHLLFVRSKLLKEHDLKAEKIHTICSKEVCARNQAAIAEAIFPLLSERELSVFLRGRNAKNNQCAKNASVQEYRLATAFEALLGYLFLQGNIERIEFLLSAYRRNVENES